MSADASTLENRRAPRILLVDQSASVELKTQHGLTLSASPKVIVPVLLRDVSTTGLSFVAPGGRRTEGGLLARGGALTLFLPVPGRTLAIPARIAWTWQATAPGQPVAAGVRLQTEATDSATRRWLQGWLALVSR